MHNPHVWGWEIAVYLFLGGLTAGVMIAGPLLSRLVERQRQSTASRLLPFAAPLVLSAGMLALFLDLGSKLHVWRFYTALRLTSPMSWGAWILLAIYPVSILYGLARMPGGGRLVLPEPAALVAAWAEEHEDGLARLNIAFGIALGAYTGVLLATLGARVLWASMLLAPLFLVSGFSAGAAFAMLLPLSEPEHRLLARWDKWAIVGELLLIAAVFIELVTAGGSRGGDAVALFFGGRYTAPFWVFVVVAGLAVPLFLEVAQEKRKLAFTALAPALLLAGGFALRWVVVFAGQVS